MESKANVRRGAKDLQLFERKRIEQMHSAGHSAEEIAVEIGVCYVTIYRELKRGDTGEMDELGRRVYDAELAQRKARPCPAEQGFQESGERREVQAAWQERRRRGSPGFRATGMRRASDAGWIGT